MSPCLLSPVGRSALVRYSFPHFDVSYVFEVAANWWLARPGFVPGICDSSRANATLARSSIDEECFKRLLLSASKHRALLRITFPLARVVVFFSLYSIPLGHTDEVSLLDCFFLVFLYLQFHQHYLRHGRARYVCVCVSA